MLKYFPFFLLFLSMKCEAQSYNEEKTAAINFIKRVYNSAPFEGTKTIEGDNKNFYVVALNIKNTDKLINWSDILTKAESVAQIGFAEPCVLFESIQKIEHNSYQIYLFACETLSSYLSESFKKVPGDGAKLIVTNNSKFITCTITIDDSKYNNVSIRDKVASMKAKQQVNLLLNGSTISSESIINLSTNNQGSQNSISETIKESSMGFINGLQLLKTIMIKPNYTTYFFIQNAKFKKSNSGQND